MSEIQFDQAQKLAIVEKGKEFGIKEAAKIAGVHYTTVYDWQRDLEALGKERFLAYEPRRPGRGRKQISEKQEESVLEAWQRNKGYGPGQVREQLRRQGETLSMRSVRRIMEANGYVPTTRKSKGEKCRRFEAARPLELGQMDILQFFINKLQVYLLLLIDDFSRFILGWRLLEQTSIDAVIDVVRDATNRYGKIEELLTDRGFVFYSWRGVNRFERYLEAERIEHTHASAHHPQTLGKVEALNRRVKTELIGSEQFLTLKEAESTMTKWVSHYNYERPHQGLGGFLTPAERFHGRADEVSAEILKGIDVTGKTSYMERSIINLVLAPDGKLTFYLLGQALKLEGLPT